MGANSLKFTLNYSLNFVVSSTPVFNRVTVCFIWKKTKLKYIYIYAWIYMEVTLVS